MGKLSFFGVICACLALSTLIDALASKLQSYNVDPSSVTVSGISAGAAMATQFHFAHSTEVFGVGMVAGLPYRCTSLGLVGAYLCMNTPFLTNVYSLIAKANSYAANNLIDPTSNIQGDRVFIFQSPADTTVYPGNGVNIQTMYNFLGAQISTEFSVAASHGFPTNNYGAACGSDSSQTAYINNCNYNGAFHMLNYLYNDNLIQPAGGEENLNNLITFDQVEFFTQDPSLSSMDEQGFVYVPTNCQTEALCKLHIVYHGCLQNSGTVETEFVLHSGYLDVAEVNNIIILFPQTTKLLVNPKACFDWWGYIDGNFATKQGKQIIATYSMMNRIIRG